VKRTVHDILSIRDKGVQSDIAILDFSKAFDKVPHARLINKLRLYGIHGNTLNWIEAFLHGRTQEVVIDGQFSREADVTSRVPQGTVMGPLLFLLFINDLPSVVDPSTTCRLFADDCLIYREIHNEEDQVSLQKDLTALEQWSVQWGMHFNAKKCNIMTVSRGTPLHKFYQLNDTILDGVDSCTYLGVTLSKDAKWTSHVTTCAKKANARLGFLRRNLRGCPKDLKRTAYVSLVRSLMEYSASIWDPHLVKDKNALEAVQRRAARWIRRDYSSRASVSAMLKELGLDNLEQRREDQRLTLMYKLVNGLVVVQPADIGLLPADSRTRAAHSQKFRHQRSITIEMRHSFAVRTIHTWNNLPVSTAEAGSLTQFKGQLSKQHSV
jgi:hypothetical protein